MISSARVVGACLAVAGVVTLLLLPGAGREAAAQSDRDELVAQGRDLFSTGCSSCHGTDGRGVRLADGEVRGPSLEDAGEAGAVYYLTTGRMPLANSNEVPERKQPAYRDEEIEALVAYVGSLGSGPKRPSVDLDAADRSEGGVLFRDNCQACHSATGAGGALSYGRSAPSLQEATPLQVGAAMRIGPGEMPRFSEEQFPDEDVDDIASYVEYLRTPDDRGGVPLGRLGPVPEGLFLWTVAVGVVVLLCVWIGGRRHEEPDQEEAA
ncbi:MAG: menaquinol-cytochrome c reductase cytochrome c1 subunit precursor [Ilumatobacteraceae bacterium]|nr:menaquinol-cytochrome c reductase cytochrome c1 subunit precursor [Ilumatobacteraceae bacterium]